MRKIKMIVTDLDGTLIRNDKSVSEYTLQVLKECQNRGIPVAIATARFWIGAEKYITLLQPDYVMSADGTMIHSKDAKMADCAFDVPTTNRLIRLIQEVNPNAEIVTAIDKKVYWNSLHISESERLYKAEYFDYMSELTEGAHKIAAELPNKATADSIAQKCACKYISYRGENLYGFIPMNAGKLTMIQMLAEKLSIPLEQIAAFGDDENDIEMLKACGLGVAVANGLSEVKAVADCVTLSNDEDGVAHFIENEIL